MSNVQPLRIPTPEEALLARRFHATRDAHQLVIAGGEALKLLPHVIKQALKCEAWKERLTPNGAKVENASFHEWVENPYPAGIGGSVDLVRKLIDGDAEALVAFDRAVQRSHGGDRRSKDAINVDIIHDEKRPAGTSSQASIRRLRKEAEAGDDRASALLKRVEAGEVKPNRAAIEMGWRKPTLTIVDDPEKILDALVAKVGLRGAHAMITRRIFPEPTEQ